MKKHSFKLLICITAVAVISAATMGLASERVRYQTNPSGETYGTLEDMDMMGELPDLILAQGPDGTQGYIRASDWTGDLAQTPEEAVAQMKTRSAELQSIPLYAADGETVVGEFTFTE